jgi:hypothetical protein
MLNVLQNPKKDVKYAGTGVQPPLRIAALKLLDSGFHRNDEMEVTHRQSAVRRLQSSSAVSRRRSAVHLIGPKARVEE